MTPEQAVLTLFSYTKEVQLTVKQHLELQACYELVMKALAELQEFKLPAPKAEVMGTEPKVVG